jgi:hypothetical protein
LADFPATTGGGSSVSYYLNGSVSQGTIGGVAYKELNKTPIFGAGTDITISADGYIASFITDAGDPNKLLIPAGNWNLETYFSASSNGGSPSFYVELYKYNGTTFTLIATSSSAPELIAFGTNLNPYFSTLAVPETVLALTDRLALRYYVTHSGRTITLHTENNHLCQVITTFTTGLTALNGLTSQVQYLTVGTSGTDFAISSVTDTHTFNLPTASATNRGALSSADWTTFNNKTSNLGTVTSVGLSSATSGVTIGSTPITTSGTITLAIATASGSQNGLLSSTDWTTFNGKQNALTNPVTGTGTSGQVAYFSGTSAITGDSDLVFDGNNLTLGGNLTAGNKLNNEFIFQNNGTFSGGSGAATIINVKFGTQTIALISATGTDQRDGIFKLLDEGVIKVSIAANNARGGATYFNGGGNVLIGTTTDNGARFQVAGTATISGDLGVGRIPSSGYKVDIQGSGGLRILDNDVLRSIIITPPVSGSKGVISTASGEGISLQSTNASGFVTIETAGAERFKIDSIGTSMFTRSGKSITLNANVSALNVDSEIEITSGMNLFFKLGGQDRFRIISGGNVGIGATSPTHKLQILGGSDSGLRITNSSGDTRILLNPSGGQHGEFNLFNNSGNSTTYLGGNGGNNYLQAQGGNFGIGTASPTTRLHVETPTGNDQVARFSRGPSNAGDIMFGLGDYVAGYQARIGALRLAFEVNRVNGAGLDTGTTAMFINTSANVLIGRTSDIGGKLQVNGQVKADSFALYIASAFRGGVYTYNQVAGSGTDYSVGIFSEGEIFLAPGGSATKRMSMTNAGAVTFSNLGTGTVTATAGLLSTVSDLSYKIEDGYIDSAIEKVLNLKPRYFYWNEKSGLPKNIRQLGFYAQEVNQALGEEAANTPKNENTPWGISDRSIIAMLTKAIQELKQEIDTLKN